MYKFDIDLSIMPTFSLVVISAVGLSMKQAGVAKSSAVQAGPQSFISCGHNRGGTVRYCKL